MKTESGDKISNCRPVCNRFPDMPCVYKDTCRVQYPNIPRAGRIGAHGGATGRGRSGLDADRTRMPPKGFRGRGLNQTRNPFRGGKVETLNPKGFRFGLNKNLNPLLNQTPNPFGFQTGKLKQNPKPFRVSREGFKPNPKPFGLSKGSLNQTRNPFGFQRGG